MSGHNRGEAEIKPLQFFESLRIFSEIGKVEITELLFENAVAVENFLSREKNKDAVRRVRGTQIDRLQRTAL
jgi:hypothetical protein